LAGGFPRRPAWHGKESRAEQSPLARWRQVSSKRKQYVEGTYNR
jgi:hypothetical protein